MNLKTFTIAGLLTAGLAFTTTGCEAVKDALFQAFSARGIEETFTIPVISDTTLKVDFGTLKDEFNIDSIIKAETGGQFSLADIKKITVEEAKLTLLDADADNNFANFQEGWLTFNTNSNPTPVEIATGLNPDVYSEVWFLPPLTGVNLKDYMSGTELNYVVAGKARRATTKPLTCKLSVKFLIE